MDFTLENFDFRADTLTTADSIDKLLEEYDLRIQEYDVKLNNRNLQLKKAENRSEDLDGDIVELESVIAAKETGLASQAAGSRKHVEVEIELDALKVRLRKLNFRKGETVPPEALVDRNADNGEAQLLLAYYTRLKEALVQRKGEL